MTIQKVSGSVADPGTYTPRTAAEIAASVTPTNYYYQPGDVRRYGASPSASASTNTQALNDACRSTALVVIPAGTYYVDPRHMLYDDGVYSQATRVGVSIPSHTSIIGYGAILQVQNTNSDSYSILASYNTSNVHIKGVKLIGDKDVNTSNPLLPNDYGFGIDFRDVEDCSVEDVTSNKMWGDSFYLGIINNTGTGSNRVTYRNITGISSRRQGLSITGGQNISIDGYHFDDIAGAAFGPCAGIDIEPNTTDYVNNVQILNGCVKNSNRPIQFFKVVNITIDNLQTENCVISFPILSDRVFDAVINNVVARGGAATNYGILWQDSPDLLNVQVSNFSIAGCALYAFYISDTVGHSFQDVVFRNGKIFVKDAIVNTSYVSCQTLEEVSFENVGFVIPSGFDNSDAVNLSPSTYIVDSNKAVFKNCNVLNKGTAALTFDCGQYGNRGNIFTNINYTKDTLALQNSWLAQAGYEAPWFFKNSDNEVCIYGTMDSGTGSAGTLLFTLPSGFRPGATIFAPIVARDGGALVSGKGVTIDTDGTCVLTDNTGTNRVGMSIKFTARL